MASIDECRYIDLPRIEDPRGSLSFVEGDRHIPFPIARVFYLYDVPTASYRGAHAHRSLQQFLLCIGGGFEVALDDGRQRRQAVLNRPWHGLYVPPMIWTSLNNFHPGSICLVLASAVYDASDYYRNYDEFLAAVHCSCTEGSEK
jgi:hypothetical protein